MYHKELVKVAISTSILIVAVVFFSSFSVFLQGHKEEGSNPISLIIDDTMTVRQFAHSNAIPNPILKEIMGLANRNDLDKNILQFGLSSAQIIQRTTKRLTLKAEYASRNWIKIPLKFGLILTMLIVVFIMLRNSRVTVRSRKILLGIAVAVFGVILGADPNPMGTVKDTIVLLGTKKMIFPPRIVALTVFLTMVVIANKFICSWACHFGTLQDLFFRFSTESERKIRKLHVHRFKVPFIISNLIRILFFIAIILSAFLYDYDIAGVIDPFKIFNPVKIGLAGGLFIGMIVLTSLFIYRPWCHFFCPFGLVGWVLEKISIFRIRVNYPTCIACQKCATACPSTVMGAILKRDKIIPDCFSCGTCLEVCPTKSISFSPGPRKKPETQKFITTPSDQ